MATARRTAPAARGRTAAAPVGPGGYRGAAGYAKMQEEEAANEARREASQQMAGMPFRFFCPQGDTREIVVIDDAPDFFRFEHNLKDKRSGKWNIFTACINENAACPVCKVAERDAYFAMYLTIIDLTPYENKDGVEVPWSKKLLVVKSAQQKKIMRLYERLGSLRGVILAMTRDGEKDAAIGNDIEYVETMSEDDLLSYETEYVDQKNKTHEVIGHEVFDYDELFPAPTEESLRAIAGGKAEPGSRESDRETLRGGARPARGRGNDDWEAPPARAAVRGRTRPEPEPDDEAEQEAPPPRGAVRRTAAAPAAPARGAAVRRTARTIDPDDLPDAGADDEPEQEAPPARTAVRRAAAPVRTRQAEPEYEEEAEDPPQRGRAAPARRAAAPAAAPSAASLADRRRALRR